jgi:hypothetical protein
MLIPGTEAFPTDVRVIDDGDGCSNAEHGATASDLADRTKFLFAMHGSIWLPLNTLNNLDSRFTFVLSPHCWEQTSVASAGRLIIPVPMPARGKVTGVTCDVKAAAAHAGLPATMPALALLRQPADGSTVTVVASASDTSANTTAYQAAHQTSLGVLAHTVLTTGTYYVRYEGETGANSLAGLQLYRITVTLAPS